MTENMEVVKNSYYSAIVNIIFVLMQAKLPLEVARAIALKYKGLVHPMVHALRQDRQVISEGILIPSRGIYPWHHTENGCRSQCRHCPVYSLCPWCGAWVCVRHAPRLAYRCCDAGAAAHYAWLTRHPGYHIPPGYAHTPAPGH